MIPFISVSGTTVTIDGSAKEIQSKITKFYDGESAVQLRRARKAESNFEWLERKVERVILKNVLIYDEDDITCLAFFIAKGVKIDGEDSYLSPDALDRFNASMEHLMSCNISVVKGSTIRIPSLGGYSGLGQTWKAQSVAEKIGFTTLIG